MSVDTLPPATACPACGAELAGRFCASCGQRAGRRVLSVRALLREVVEDQFSVNATLPRTMRGLFFRPGFLTTEYLRQRISLYVPPFRLYLIASVLFFIVASFTASTGEMTPEDVAEWEATRAAVRDSVAARAARGEAEPPGPLGVRVDPTAANWADRAQIRLGSERLENALRARLKTLEALPPPEAFRRLFAGTIASAPKVMFLLLPLYALLLKLLYIRRRRYYVEHFIFALHIHAFTFGLFTIMLLLSPLPAVAGVLLLWLLLYAWLALKRVYGQGWIRTTVKWFVLGQLYLIAVSFGLILALLAAVFTI